MRIGPQSSLKIGIMSACMTQAHFRCSYMEITGAITEYLFILIIHTLIACDLRRLDCCIFIAPRLITSIHHPSSSRPLLVGQVRRNYYEITTLRILWQKWKVFRIANSGESCLLFAFDIISYFFFVRVQS